MKYNSLVRILLGAVAAVAVAASPAFAQATGGPTTGGSTTGGGTTNPGSTGGGLGGNTRQPSTQLPNPTDPNRDRFPDMNTRPIFVSGRVMLDDGTPPPEPVAIERVCNGQPRIEGHTNSKGHFQFQLGQNLMSSVDASTGGFGNDPFNGMGGGRSNNPMNPNGRTVTERDLFSCELRASLPGFRSDTINLAGRRSLENPEVGTIILHRMANVQGLTISATSAMAPKDARKAYDKGRDLAKKQKWPEAQKEFEKAVEIYPKYANAWLDLGIVQEHEKNIEGARKSYNDAIAQDGKLVDPYIRMSFLAARDSKWEEVAELSDHAVKLNPYDYPTAYLMNSIANFNMHKLDEAEKSAREGLKVDSRHTQPKIQHVLGLVLAQKQDFAGASEQMKGYLKFVAEDDPTFALVKKQLADVEKFAQAKNETRPPEQQ